MSAIAQGKQPQHRVGRYGRTCFLSSFCKLESRSGANVRSDWRSQSGTISWGPLGLLVVETCDRPGATGVPSVRYFPDRPFQSDVAIGRVRRTALVVTLTY